MGRERSFHSRIQSERDRDIRKNTIELNCLIEFLVISFCIIEFHFFFVEMMPDIQTILSVFFNQIYFSDEFSFVNFEKIY